MDHLVSPIQALKRCVCVFLKSKQRRRVLLYLPRSVTNLHKNESVWKGQARRKARRKQEDRWWLRSKMSLLTRTPSAITKIIAKASLCKGLHRIASTVFSMQALLFLPSLLHEPSLLRHCSMSEPLHLVVRFFL
ncbi:hypothetical protein DM860_018301 [Cuscuta australis]|uniref:Uncharacterized protein n=1 Tax=Cuscuta australis TaxID=267555 RepID=A0A328DJ07_9ASTE|nr:hypothetical protein DM860_018301 [Cuscuta australis]